MSDNLFADPSQTFEVQQQKLARRRKLAEQLVQQGMQTNGQMVGNIYVTKNPWQNFAESFAGSAMNTSADSEQTDLARQEQQAAQTLIERLGTPGMKEQTGPTMDGSAMPQGPLSPEEEDARRIGVIGEGMAIPSLRQVLSQQLGQELDYPRQRGQEKAKTAAESARLTAQDERQAKLFLQQQQLLDKRLEGQKDLRAMPTIHISQGGNNQRDRYQIIADADGSQYRVNLDTGEKMPLGLVKPAGAKGAPGEKPLTEAQGNAYLFGTRADEAHKILDNVGTNYSPMKVSIAGAMDKVPGVNAGANAMLPENEQKVMQAQRNFVNAILRKESGAAIAQSEFDNARKQYFPQPGDSEAVIKQKRTNRETAIAGLAKIVGPQGKDIGKPTAQPTVVRTGTRNGVRVEQLSDGSIREVK